MGNQPCNNENHDQPTLLASQSPGRLSYEQLMHEGVAHGEGFKSWLARDELSQQDKQRLLGQALVHWQENILEIYRGTRQSVVALIESGANPLAPFPDVPTSHEAPLLFDHLAQRHPDVALHLVNILYAAKKDLGQDYLAENQRNILHKLCGLGPEWLGSALDSAQNDIRVRVDPTQTMSLPQKVNIHPEWVNQADDEGKSPLHLVWERAVYCLMSGDRDGAYECWDASEYLCHMGGSLLARDKQGSSPAQMILNCTAVGLEVPSNVDIDVIRAQSAASDLDQATPARANASARRTL